MAKYSFDLKLKIATEYLQGEISYDSLAKKHGIGCSQIKLWVNKYKTFGEHGLKRSRNNQSYSVEFKLEAIALYETGKESYLEISNRLNLSNPSLIANWRRQYREKGIDGLSSKKGRPPKVKKDKSPNNTKIETNFILELEQAKRRIQELEFENRKLKIKTEYLEQLRSLRIREKTKEKQESSTNSEKDIH